jgi:PAS domain S-box-containing protein
VLITKPARMVGFCLFYNTIIYMQNIGALFLYISPLIFSALLGPLLAMAIARRWNTPGAKAMITLLLAASLWSAGYAAEIVSQDLTSKLFWAKFQYFGIVSIPPAWFCFAILYLGSPGWTKHPWLYRVLLAIIPVITVGLVWTNEVHFLIWKQMYLEAVGPVPMLVIEHGPWFWIYIAYCYTLLLLGSVRLAWGLLGSGRLYRWQIGLALVAILIPWLGNLLYLVDLSHVPHLDWTPFCFSIAGLLLTISLFRFHLVNIMPIAEKTVFAGLADCVLVLDRHDRIVDLNLAAQKKIGGGGEESLGKSFAQIAPELAPWLAQAGFDHEFCVEFSQGKEPDQHFYELRIAPLTGPYPRPVGRLLICHDITLLKQEQARLEKVVLERTDELRQAVEQLQRELTERTLVEKRFKEVVESAPDAMFLVDQSGAIILVNVQAERLFGYTREELLGRNIAGLIPDRYREDYLNYLQQFVSDPSVRETSYDLDLCLLRKDGGEFPVGVSLGLLNTADGVWVACAIRDLSERLKAEQAQNQLMQEIKQSHAQLRALAFRLQEVQEFERRQIAAELHDRVGQNLTGLNLNLRIIENQLTPGSNGAVRSRLVDSLKLVEKTTRQVRDVMADLHPPALDEYGLMAALQWYCGDFSQRTGIAARVVGDEFEPRLPPNIEIAFFRLVQEALNNVAKHARATKVAIVAESSTDSAYLKVADDGQGFDPGIQRMPSADPHWGLIHMQQRAASIGAQLVIDSTPGQGTQISFIMRRHADED